MLKSSIKPTLDEETREYARRLSKALEPFRGLKPIVPLTYVIAFLEVAAEEGLGVSDYAQKLDTVPTVMTRNLLDIGDRNRQREEGLGLITQERDLHDLRKHNAFVTPKGKSLLQKSMAASKTLPRSP
jgi:DNA-binding MarR family transcriptional regulator